MPGAGPRLRALHAIVGRFAVERRFLEDSVTSPKPLASDSARVPERRLGAAALRRDRAGALPRRTRGADAADASATGTPSTTCGASGGGRAAIGNGAATCGSRHRSRTPVGHHLAEAELTPLNLVPAVLIAKVAGPLIGVHDRRDRRPRTRGLRHLLCTRVRSRRERAGIDTGRRHVHVGAVHNVSLGRSPAADGRVDASSRPAGHREARRRALPRSATREPVGSARVSAWRSGSPVGRAGTTS